MSVRERLTSDMLALRCIGKKEKEKEREKEKEKDVKRQNVGLALQSGSI